MLYTMIYMRTERNFNNLTNMMQNPAISPLWKAYFTLTILTNKILWKKSKNYTFN